MRTVPLALLAWLALASAAHAVSVNEVPDPRPRSAVVDLTGTLTPGDLQAIDAAASRGRSRGELLVAVIDSLDGLAAREYATLLFNTLRLDKRQRNRGVLLLAALKDRKAEIVVGDGFEDSITRTTDLIMREVVVRHFRQGAPRKALVEGAQALSDQVLLGQSAPPLTPPVPPGPPPPASAAVPEPQAEPSTTSPPTPHPPAPVSGSSTGSRSRSDAPPLGLWGGLGALGLGALAAVRRYFRMRPRQCTRCGQQMIRLGEDADDEHLTSGERAEERVGSVDYDIWMCPSCRHTLKLRYGTLFTRYSSCRQCSAKTVKTTTTTLEAATEYSTGRARVEEDCEHCGHHRSRTKIIPKRPRSSHRSSSGGGGSSSSGGGSSSGRGSSGSW